MTDHKQSTYVRVWVTKTGAFRFHNHQAKDAAIVAFNANVRTKPIWAAVIDFNHNDLTAKTLKYHREPE